ncbi:Uncharacterised protein [uncultured archaeon]|nr:Uncharacterised protein [uncultured archaeon]
MDDTNTERESGSKSLKSEEIVLEIKVEGTSINGTILERHLNRIKYLLKPYLTQNHQSHPRG